MKGALKIWAGLLLLCVGVLTAELSAASTANPSVQAVASYLVRNSNVPEAAREATFALLVQILGEETNGERPTPSNILRGINENPVLRAQIESTLPGLDVQALDPAYAFDPYDRDPTDYITVPMKEMGL